MTRYCTVLLLVSGAAASWPLAWPTNTELSEWTHPEPTPGSNFDGDKNVDPESKYAARWFAHGRNLKNMDIEALLEDYGPDSMILHVNQYNKTYGRYIGKDGAREYYTWLLTTMQDDDGSFMKDFEFTIATPPNQTVAAPIVTRNTVFQTWGGQSGNTIFKNGVSMIVMDPTSTLINQQYVNVHATTKDAPARACPKCPWDPEFYQMPVQEGEDQGSFQGDKHVDPATNIYAARWFKHGRSFKQMDAAAVAADYAEDAVIHHVNQYDGTFTRHYGRQGALEYFTWLFTVMNNGHGGFMEDFSFTIAPPPGQSVAAPIISGNTVYETWQAGSSNTRFRNGVGNFVMDPVTTLFKEQYVNVIASPVEDDTHWHTHDIRETMQSMQESIKSLQSRVDELDGLENHDSHALFWMLIILVAAAAIGIGYALFRGRNSEESFQGPQVLGAFPETPKPKLKHDHDNL